MNTTLAGRPSSIYVNREVEGDMRLYVDLFSNPQRLLRDGLADESYSDAFQLALRRDHLLQSIGNLTLVTSPLNSKMGNHPFLKKRNALRKYSDLKLNKEICREDDWNVNVICERSEQLITYFCKIWSSLDRFSANLHSL